MAAFRRAARSPNTFAAYQADWARFQGWFSRHGTNALPAEPGVVAAYLAEAANATDPRGRSAPWCYSPTSLERWTSTNKAHDLAGLRPPGRDPEVRDTLAGVRRVRAAPQQRKTPLLLADLEHVIDKVEATTWPAAPGGIRNRCLLAVGWVGAFRRRELVELLLAMSAPTPRTACTYGSGCPRPTPKPEDAPTLCPTPVCPCCAPPAVFVRWRRVVCAWEGTGDGPEGRAGVMRVTRGDDPGRHVCQDGTVTASIAVADPAAALFRSVRVNGTLSGPINGHTIDAVVKRAAEAVGFDPDLVGGHSLRAGFVTQAFRSGADAHAIMRQTGHRDPRTFEIYARETAPWSAMRSPRSGCDHPGLPSA